MKTGNPWNRKKKSNLETQPKKKQRKKKNSNQNGAIKHQYRYERIWELLPAQRAADTAIDLESRPENRKKKKNQKNQIFKGRKLL